MEKKEVIERIKSLLSTYGCFNIGELDQCDSSPCVGTLGGLLGLAEYFTEDYVEVNVYNTNQYSSEAIETYEELYENLTEEVLHEIMILCEQWEVETLKTEKRISNE
jgi:hypothetical protein